MNSHCEHSFIASLLEIGIVGWGTSGSVVGDDQGPVRSVVNRIAQIKAASK